MAVVSGSHIWSGSVAFLTGMGPSTYASNIDQNRRKPVSLIFAIRADASPQMGHGHVMRCLTLANKLSQTGAWCHFLSLSMPKDLEHQIEKCGHTIRKLEREEDVSACLKSIQANWLIIDHYEIDQESEAEWLAEVPGIKIMVIDDLANRMHKCDVLLDITPGRETADYDGLVPRETTLCLGVDFALIADDFVKERPAALAKRKSVPQKPNLLVTLGGGDNSAELKTIALALEKVAQTQDFSLRVIAPDKDAALFQSLPDVEHVSFTTQMAQHMAEADYCIGAAGGTSWERCCLGLPTLVIKVAENQKDNFEYLQKVEAAIAVSCDAEALAEQVIRLMGSESLRLKLVEQSSQLCDGRGASRVKDHLLARSITLRPAVSEDASFVYAARYGDGAEKFYRNPVKPDFADHVAWFNSVLSERNRNLMILELEGEPLAHVRFDHLADDTEAEIGVAIAPDYRGKGYGAAVLLASCADYFAKGGKTIHAEISTHNHASLKSFESAGFQATGVTRDGMPSYILTG